MISTIMGFLKSTSMKYLSAGAAVLVILIYWYILEERLQTAIEAKQYAEDNVVLVTREFDNVLKRYGELEISLATQEEYYKDSIEALEESHAEAIEDAVKIATIKDRIEGVTDEEDGNVSNVLSSTLDALRMY